MRRIRLVIEYDGTNYVGWQRQPNGLSVQEALEKELKVVTGENISLVGSGRTDSGVHALAQVAHFDTSSRMPADRFTYALNAGLPRDIRVHFSDEAGQDFHARFSAKHKQYRYLIWNDVHASALQRNMMLHLHYRLDETAMQKAASLVLGCHDFSAFKVAAVSMENTTRTLFKSEWKRRGSLLIYEVEGNGFLYNMVRILVGTMLEIGSGKREAGSIARLLDKGEREAAGPTAPAHGLMLMRVVYSGFDSGDYVKVPDLGI